MGGKCITKPPCQAGKFREGHVPLVHDLPGFYPSVEPRHARPETLGPDTTSNRSRNPSFPLQRDRTILRQQSHGINGDSSRHLFSRILLPLTVSIYSHWRASDFRLTRYGFCPSARSRLKASDYTSENPELPGQYSETLFRRTEYDIHKI
jgi:hypothetical protein